MAIPDAYDAEISAEAVIAGAEDDPDGEIPS
jgi:hypothetical protein